VPRVGALWTKISRILYDDAVVFGSGNCCGMPFFLSGKMGVAKRRGEEIIRRLRDFDVIITGCPSCYRMFSEFYPGQLGLEVGCEVLHVVQALWRGLKEGRIRPRNSVNIRVTYHDPCELSRHAGLMEEPRKILEVVPGLEFVETELNGKLSTCCGGGGLMRVLFPKISQEIAIRKLIDEIVPLGVSAVVTACPFCEYVLEDALRSTGNEHSIRIMDISEIILMSLGAGDESE